MTLLGLFARLSKILDHGRKSNFFLNLQYLASALQELFRDLHFVVSADVRNDLVQVQNC